MSARPFAARDARECRRRRGWQGDVRLMGPIRRQAALAKSVTVGRAGEGPNWRGFCAAVTLRFSASSPELAGGGRRQPGHPILRGVHTGAVSAAGARHRSEATRALTGCRSFFQQAAPGAACFFRHRQHRKPGELSDSGPNVQMGGDWWRAARKGRPDDIK